MVRAGKSDAFHGRLHWGVSRSKQPNTETIMSSVSNMNTPLEIVVETSQTGFLHPGLPVHFLQPGKKTH